MPDRSEAEQAARCTIARAARNRDRPQWERESLILSDYLEDQGRQAEADHRRDRVRSRRAPGLLWPRICTLGGDLSPHQQQTLRRVLTQRVAILAGTPGTGKTHTTGALVHALADRYGPHDIAVCAPTGKAAVRVAQAMARAGVTLPARTIHSLLEIGRNGHDGDGWGFQRNASRPLDQRFVIVDESSMLDTDLAASLLSACAPGTHVLLVGDPYQLPPVGHGAPLRDLIASGKVPCGELSEIRRNAGQIVAACAAIRLGKPFETSEVYNSAEGRNLVHLEAGTPEELTTTCIRLAKHVGDWAGMGALDPFDVQVICATNRMRNDCNRVLQSALNVPATKSPPNPFWAADKIICLKNHWAIMEPSGECYIANGEIGMVTRTEQRTTWARFPGGREVRIPMAKRPPGDSDDEGDGGGTGCDFALAYTITGHKSQGSEWPVIILLIDPSMGARQVCSREWVYTAISRASQLCVTIGRRGVLEQMAKRPALLKRKTFLKEMLQGVS